MEKRYVFVYGSLLSLKSLQRTLPEKEHHSTALLNGYRRITSKLSSNGTVLFMNLIGQQFSSVKGKLVEVSPTEFEEITRREQEHWLYRTVLRLFRLWNGYDIVDVTEAIEPTPDGVVVAFIAPSNPNYRDYMVLRSYLNTCLDGVPEDEQEAYIEETLLGGAIIEDMDAPLYGTIENTKITKTKIV